MHSNPALRIAKPLPTMYSENKARQLAEQYSYLKGMEINGREIVGIEVPEVRLKIGLAELRVKKQKDPDYENMEIERLKKGNNWKVLLRLDNGDSYDLEHGLELMNHFSESLKNSAPSFKTTESIYKAPIEKPIKKHPILSKFSKILLKIVIGVIIGVLVLLLGKIMFNL